MDNKNSLKKKKKKHPLLDVKMEKKNPKDSVVLEEFSS